MGKIEPTYTFPMEVRPEDDYRLTLNYSDSWEVYVDNRTGETLDITLKNEDDRFKIILEKPKKRTLSDWLLGRNG